MTGRPFSAIAGPLRAEAADDNWVLALSPGEPGGVLPGRIRWAERGPLRGFFQGLLFDRKALELSIDVSQSDSSDADLVLSAYERGGEGALSRLRGSFVVVVIDRRGSMAIVQRDPLGSHPLFYVEAGSSVLFASAQQALLDQPGVSRALNRAALADHLMQPLAGSERDFFRRGAARASRLTSHHLGRTHTSRALLGSDT